MKHSKNKTFRKNNNKRNKTFRKNNNKRKHTQKGGKIIDVYSDNSSYNDNLYVRESHNCYTYFLNLKNDESVKMCKKAYSKHYMCRRAQPG